MSVPREILDQLLSGHLDGALSSEESKQIEQILRDDPSVARQLDELRDLRISLREISRIDNRVKLDGGFADRVLSAAVARATAEGLRDDHPLVSLAEKPSRPEAKRIPMLRIASAIVGLAAMIATVIVVMQPPKKPTNVAKLNPTENVISPNTTPNGLANVAPADVPTIDLLDPRDLVDPRQQLGPQPDSNAMAEQVAKSATDTDNADNIARVDTAGSDSVQKPSITSVAKPSSMPEFTEADLIALQRMQNQSVRGAPLFVIKVKRTELGRSTRCVRESLKAAGLAQAQEKELTADMVSFLSEESKKESIDRVMFLDASSKKIDVFVNRLFADTSGIQTVGLSLAPSRSIVQVADLIAPHDATTVRHANSWNLQGSGLGALVGELDRQQIQMRQPNAVPLRSTSSDGPDEMSQVLIWIQQ